MKPSALPVALMLTAAVLAACSSKEPVREQSLRAAQKPTLNLQRNSDGIVDGIVAEDIGKFPDTNIPEAVQRVEGVAASGTAPLLPAPPAAPAPIMAGKRAMSPSIAATAPWRQEVESNRFPSVESSKMQLVAEHPVSTFSADVDTASYAVMRRMLSGGRMPYPDAVRVEEMVNYFPYHYAGPASAQQPFAVSTEVMPAPWKAGNQLVHIALRGFDIQASERPRANVVLLVDVSGSMAPSDRLPLLKQGFHLFAEQLRPEDRVAIVTYADGTNVALEPTAGSERQKILDAVDRLGAGGGTAGAEGLQRAYAMAERHFDPKAVNRVILATDGDFNLGLTDPKALEQFIVDKRKTGVYLSILGVGIGNLNDALAQRLAQAGNGNAAYIDSLLEARKAMSQELGSTMFPIANDVKAQVEFNPAQVAAYRLIGYETRALQREDFKNDKVDAGDMGSGHTVTAIYEITPAANAGQLVDPLRYQKGEKAGSKAGKRGAGAGDELCFVKVRYKLPGASSSREISHAVHAQAAKRSLAQVPDDQRFAVAVAAFGQKLRGETALADYGYGEIAELANGARGPDREGYRAEFVRLVRMADSLRAVGQR